MTEKQHILKELDAAIDRMDLAAINNHLDALDTLEPRPAAEDPKLFAARIQKIEREKPMRFSKKTIVAVAAIATMTLAGFTVYAATTLNLFSFTAGDRYATVRTTDSSMTQQEAQSLALDDASPADKNEQPEQATTESFEFDTLEEAQAAMGIPVVLPENMPELELNSITAQAVHFGEDYENRTIWTSYGDPKDKAIEITVSRAIIQEGSDVTTVLQTDMDDGSEGVYRSSNGTVFTLFSESDPSGAMTAQIAALETGEYSYALVLVGYSEAEQKAMLDALDLSVYF